MHFRIALIAAFAAAPLAATTVRAQATASALSLNGVRTVNLRFLLADEDIVAGVDTARLRGIIETRLRSANIATVPGRSGGEGIIGINVGAIRSAADASVTFFYFLDFRQQVKVSRLPDPPFPPIPAATWTTIVSFGTEPGDRFRTHLDGVTTEFINKFLLDHQKGQDAVKK